MNVRMKLKGIVGTITHGACRCSMAHLSADRSRCQVTISREDGITPIFLSTTWKQMNSSEEIWPETFSPLWTHQSRLFSWDFPCPGRQNFLGGLHPGGKEFSFLKSKNPICESAGWIAIL